MHGARAVENLEIYLLRPNQEVEVMNSDTKPIMTYPFDESWVEDAHSALTLALKSRVTNQWEVDEEA